MDGLRCDGGGDSRGGCGGERERAAAPEEEEEGVVGMWGWGAGSDGQLATGGLDDQLLPQPLILRRRLNSSGSNTIAHIACGGAHAIALTGDGRVLTWGRGTRGQLGHGGMENCLEPKPVEFLESITICHVSAGWNHSGFVTDAGCLYTCGDGSFGQLGHGDHQSYYAPVEVLYFASKNVVQIACGMRHSLVLVKDTPGDLVYGFGSGRHGQLGISADEKTKSFNLPKVVDGFGNDSICCICANGDHSAALSANGQLFTWGRGFGGRIDNYIPQLLPLSLKFSQVALGWNHALALADNGEVYMLGGEHHGMLGDSQQINLRQHEHTSSSLCASLPESSTVLVLERRVHCLDGKNVVHIAAGAEHSAVVTENGEIMTWGWGEHGQLGLGNTLDQTSPQFVSIYDRGIAVCAKFRVYCGSGFTFAVNSSLTY